MNSRLAFILQVGGWLAFLVISLGAAITYLLQAPMPIGPGVIKIFGFGALAGVLLGAATPILCAPLFLERTKFGRLKVAIGCITMGALGGAGIAAWTNQLRVVEAYAVELPIVEVRHLPARRRASSIRIATLLPQNPTGQDHISLGYVASSPVRLGDCLTGIVEHGWLGGAWVKRYLTKPCSKSRGTPGRNVILTSDDFSSWRWYQPHGYQPYHQGHAQDDQFSASLACRLRAEGWLYRCVRG